MVIKVMFMLKSKVTLNSTTILQGKMEFNPSYILERYDLLSGTVMDNSESKIFTRFIFGATNEDNYLYLMT